MARGDVIVFQDTRLTLLTGDWTSTDEIWLGLTSDECVVTDAAPAYAAGGTTNYTAVATGGNYAAGGQLLNTYTAMTTEAAGTVTFADTDATAAWAKHASNPTNGEWALVYHKTSGLAIAAIDLDGPIDMTAGDLTITWDASGIFDIS